MKNKEVVKLLQEIGQLLELKGENPFRVRSYEKAAQNIASLTEPIEKFASNDRLETIPGVGEGIAKKIKEYLETGKLKYFEELKKVFPEGLLEIMSVPGIGPKTAKTLYQELKIKSLVQLEKAAKEHRLSELRRLGEKTEENIVRGIQMVRKGGERILLSAALFLAKPIIKELEKCPDVKNINLAGSIRRKKETIKDIDILCTAKKSDVVMDKFVNLPQVKEILAQGETKSSIILDEDIQVDLRVIKPESYGAALMYFTGSKDHNIALRELGRKKGYKINEYGLFKLGKRSSGVSTRGKGAVATRPVKEIRVAGKTEEEVYKKLGLQYIPPEIREASGEIEMASRNKIPRLITENDIKGDLHVHSRHSDGVGKLSEIAEKAESMGLEWVGICDHSQSLKVAGGVRPDVLYEKIEETKRFNKKSKDFMVLCGTEVDILSDGSLDYDDELLSQLDLVIAAIHTGFKQSEEQLTKRIISAMENKYVHMIAHPQGRLLGKREPYALNMEKVLRTAQETQTFLEINAYPERLDLYDIYCRKAKEKSILMGIGTDAHTLNQIENLYLGVAVARRGWLERKDVLNTLSYNELIKTLRRKKCALN
ncbi:MAG TPA: DNA polymerase/3'-5' exonuclease PolX [bacterium]|nr:DNA polymerase/3'-5' exonuclease PolX [bacterium]